METFAFKNKIENQFKTESMSFSKLNQDLYVLWSKVTVHNDEFKKK